MKEWIKICFLFSLLPSWGSTLFQVLRVLSNPSVVSSLRHLMRLPLPDIKIGNDLKLAEGGRILIELSLQNTDLYLRDIVVTLPSLGSLEKCIK